MDDLIAFLNARLDEDAETATAAAGGDPNWTANPDDRGSAIIRDGGGGVVVYDEGSPSLDEALHIARHNPARVLAEVDAKRRILNEHACPCPDPDCGDCGACSGDHHADPTPAPCTTVRLLALPFTGHPDYRPEWRP